ncbi:hypothetical protein PUMCH_001365 [Australozyma saopauloensis]|uniref:Uncharacterized protein n=1 Tax=Australozyma saopauloensis TaxID=291208 RepID=A0AAX4H6L0_9ASCO|nr:hypothetical protein PUMCH_001365 [[Candida] saopauloensis]
MISTQPQYYLDELMNKRQSLELSDIQDEDDRKHRQLRKKKKLNSRREVRILFDDEEDELVPILTNKVKEVESKLSRFGQQRNVNLAPELGSSGGHDAINVTDPENDPAMVLDEIESEDSLASIPNIQNFCRELIDSYEKRNLHDLFDSVETNCAFRLLLYAIVYGQAASWPTPNLFVRVLHQLNSQVDAENLLLAKFSNQKKTRLPKENQLPKKPLQLTPTVVGELRKALAITKDHVLLVSTPLEVPAHIVKLFQ